MTLRSETPVSFVYTSDRERALGFYRDTLGLPVRDSDRYGDFLDAGAASLRLTVLPDFKPGEHPVFGWAVSDIAATAQALRGKGVALTIYEGFGQDEDGIWTAPDGKSRLAWFPDPDGNVLMLSQG